MFHHYKGGTSIIIITGKLGCNWEGKGEGLPPQLLSWEK